MVGAGVIWNTRAAAGADAYGYVSQVDLWLTPEAEAGLMQAQCLKEKLYPPDIARMALWLAADDSRLVTAQNFVVDGGRM